MKKEKKPMLSLIRDERGAGLSEYLVLLVLVVVACIALWKTFQE
jgi:Flp pilus assembly pilin Flp